MAAFRELFEKLIRREIDHQRNGQQGHVIFKMNAIIDWRMIRLLYKVDLLVRGMCCLRPGVAAVSENIRVISIVGRFLGHSRIYYFGNAGQEEIYLGSANLMPRNLNHRVEVIFPVRDPNLVRMLHDEVFAVCLTDVLKARHMKADGSYDRSSDRDSARSLNSQEWWIRKVTANSSQNGNRPDNCYPCTSSAVCSTSSRTCRAPAIPSACLLRGT
jgi:polyphosphate kinase